MDAHFRIGNKQFSWFNTVLLSIIVGGFVYLWHKDRRAIQQTQDALEIRRESMLKPQTSRFRNPLCYVVVQAESTVDFNKPERAASQQATRAGLELASAIPEDMKIQLVRTRTARAAHSAFLIEHAIYQQRGDMHYILTTQEEDWLEEMGSAKSFQLLDEWFAKHWIEEIAVVLVVSKSVAIGLTGDPEVAAGQVVRYYHSPIPR